jgi:hypothetical protein
VTVLNCLHSLFFEVVSTWWTLFLHGDIWHLLTCTIAGLKSTGLHLSWLIFDGGASATSQQAALIFAWKICILCHVVTRLEVWLHG